MTEKYYGIYFDRLDLCVDNNGQLINPEVLQIVQYEYEEDGDEPISCCRVDLRGNIIEDPWKDAEWAGDLVRIGHGDDESIEKVMDRFYDWLDNNTEWVESLPETRWHPAEYECIGISGCV